MNKKAAIELSANYLVIIIISLALFGIGLFLFAKIIDTGEDLELKVSTGIRKQLDAAMDDGSIIAIPQQRMNAYEGERVIFSLGILNDLNDAPWKHFYIFVTPVDGTIAWGINFIDTIEELAYKDKFHSIIAIDIPIGTPKGQYGFDVKVEKNCCPIGSPYPTDKKQRIYVVVL